MLFLCKMLLSMCLYISCPWFGTPSTVGDWLMMIKVYFVQEIFGLNSLFLLFSLCLVVQHLDLSMYILPKEEKSISVSNLLVF